MCLGLGETAWRGLERDLGRAHEEFNPPLLAEQAVKGWLAAYGPAFESTRRDVLERVLRIAARHGFREIGSPEELWRVWQSSWECWNRRRKAYGKGLQD
jgi:hypothetical protein